MKAAFFSDNRHRLTAALEGAVVVMTAYTKMQRSNDAANEFDQEANFWWMTGIDAPDWWVISDGSRHKSWLVSPDVDAVHQVFDGSLSFDAAMAASGVDAVLSREEAKDMLRQLATQHSIVYTLNDQPHAEHYDFMQNPAPKKLYELLSRTFSTVRDCRKDMARLRAIKQPEEITAMTTAINLTIDAFEIVKSRMNSFSHEYEIDAEFSYHFRRHGAKGHAYDPIVASGKNACTLHYGDNSEKLKKQQLVLMDVGARYNGYAADITRTYAYGEPTKRQQAVHERVKTAHAEIISLLGPNLAVEAYQKDVQRIMAAALCDLKLASSIDDSAAYAKYFPHAISHGLGIDVHDSLGAPRYLQPGMVLTVEPGIYIPEESIGVRIEDDILITTSGHRNLSARLSTAW